MIILGIETSCDETALALLETKGTGPDFECRVIASLVHSQAELHSAYGGVYPSLAKREHGKNLVPLLHKLFLETGEALPPIRTIDLDSHTTKLQAEVEPQNPELFQSFKSASFLENVPTIDRIAVTEGPGLEPALWVGITFARMLGDIWNIPVIPVNHMAGHVVGSLLRSDTPLGAWQKLKPIEFPALCLLISGGHTELVTVNPGFEYTIIGETKDDAVGEAFDKVARLLGLPYPGGPHISMMAEKARNEGITSSMKLPRPMIQSNDLQFSFSGLKTAVLYAVRNNSNPDGSISEEFKKGLAREFEDAVNETLATKLRAAIEKTGAKTLIVGGGVSANQLLQKTFAQIAEEFGLPLYLPSRHISGDNALMIALAGAMERHIHVRPSRELKASGTKRLGQK